MAFKRILTDIYSQWPQSLSQITIYLQKNKARKILSCKKFISENNDNDYLKKKKLKTSGPGNTRQRW